LAMLASIRPILLGGAALALLVGWGLFLRRRATVCALLGIGTALVALALVWEPYLEPMVLKAIR